MLFVSGDTPPGFEVMRRRRGHEWISQNDALLRLSDNSFDRLYATVLTSLIGEGAREVALAKNRRQANTVITAVIEYARRLMADGPWKPPVKPAVRPGVRRLAEEHSLPRRSPARSRQSAPLSAFSFPRSSHRRGPWS